MATVYQEYAASSNLTVTALDSLATSAALEAGWTSGTIDNTSDKHLDKVVSAKFTKGSSPTAGQIQVWAYAMLDDSNWPDLFSGGTGSEGTEGTATIHDAEQKNENLVLLWATATDTSSGDVHNMRPVSLRERFGFMPLKCAIFVTHNMVVAMASSGNQVTVKGLYETIS